MHYTLSATLFTWFHEKLTETNWKAINISWKGTNMKLDDFRRLIIYLLWGKLLEWCCPIKKKKKRERYKGNFKFKFYSHTKTRKKKIGKIILWNEFCLTQYIQISIWYIINIKIIDKLFLHSFFILSLSNLVCISYFLDMSILTCHIPSVPQLCITHG